MQTDIAADPRTIELAGIFADAEALGEAITEEDLARFGFSKGEAAVRQAEAARLARDGRVRPLEPSMLPADPFRAELTSAQIDLRRCIGRLADPVAALDRRITLELRAEASGDLRTPAIERLADFWMALDAEAKALAHLSATIGESIAAATARAAKREETRPARYGLVA